MYIFRLNLGDMYIINIEKNCHEHKVDINSSMFFLSLLDSKTFVTLDEEKECIHRFAPKKFHNG